MRLPDRITLIFVIILTMFIIVICGGNNPNFWTLEWWKITAEVVAIPTVPIWMIMRLIMPYR